MFEFPFVGGGGREWDTVQCAQQGQGQPPGITNYKLGPHVRLTSQVILLFFLYFSFIIIMIIIITIN